MDFQNCSNALVLAPMAGITDCTFRYLCMQMGCDWGVTEMISANGLVLSPKESPIQRQLMQKAPGETVGVQLFGANLRVMEKAAQMVGDQYDFIDINMGCPSPKIVQGGAGAALGRDRGLARLVIEAVRQACAVPVTVKIRLGWDDGHLNYMDMVEMAGQAGAAAIAIHGRTRAQMYAGRADMQAIARAAAHSAIPVIANGDIASPEDALRVFETTRCQAVMIGRGAAGNPFLFRQIKQYLHAGRYDPVTPEEKLSTALTHIRLLRDLKGEAVAAKEMRKHIGWYIKGLRDAAAMREKINTAPSTDALSQMLADYMRSQYGAQPE